MSGVVVSLLVFVALVVIVVMIVLGSYNRLIALKNRYENGFAQIEVQLKRRHDLIPNLVETVKGYMSHERETLEAVIQARNQAVGGLEQASGNPGDPGAMKKLAGAEGALTGAMGRLFALSEAYPDLKASAGFRQLHESLVDVEDKLQNARRYYNAVVRDFNTRIQSFPDLLLAGVFGFTEREFFELDSAAEAAVPRLDLEGSR
jgi:LemA protein